MLKEVLIYVKDVYCDVWFVELVLKNQGIGSFILSSPIRRRPGN